MGLRRVLSVLHTIAYMIIALLRFIITYTSLHITLKIRLYITTWRNTRKFRKTLKQQGIPKQLINELTEIYRIRIKEKTGKRHRK